MKKTIFILIAFLTLFVGQITLANKIPLKKQAMLDAKEHFIENFAPDPETVKFRSELEETITETRPKVFKIVFKGTCKSTLGKIVSFTAYYEVDSNFKVIKMINLTK